MNVKHQVLDRYSEGAKEKQEALCCPVDYDVSLLKQLPEEIIEKDYGCGDPSRYVRDGDVVLDLGSGGGKICYMAAQLVGNEGRVIGVDMNDDMLALARKYQAQMAEQLGGDRVQFLKGHIEDLALDLSAMGDWLQDHSVADVDSYSRLEAWQATQRAEQPLIADHSIDLVISNCVLNLVHDEQKSTLINEIFRVLKPGGRVAISDIISDQYIPEAMKKDAELWSGCISGAFQEQEFLDAFTETGFHAAAYDKWDAEPWRVVDGIEFRSVTLTAVKPEEVSDLEHNHDHALLYRGPYDEVCDDEGNVYTRGVRVAVSERTFGLLLSHAYQDNFIGFSPDGTQSVAKTNKTNDAHDACCSTEKSSSCC